jgi:hypothetical protein
MTVEQPRCRCGGSRYLPPTLCRGPPSTQLLCHRRLVWWGMHETQTFEPRMDPSALDLLSTAYQLAATANQWVWLGASRNLSSPSMFQGWAWVDGTNSSNLNCGGPGCGPWTGNEPKYVPTGVYTT